MDFDFEFLRLPVELQAEILLQEDLPTLYHLCQTSRHVRSLCYDDGLWRRMYFNTLESEFRKSSNRELVDVFRATNTNLSQNPWLKRMKLLRMLQNPDYCCTFSVQFDNVNDEYVSPLILGNYKTHDLVKARRCIVDEYNSQVEPIFSTFRTSMINLIEANVGEIHSGVFDNIVPDFQNVLNQSLKFDESTLYDITNASGDLGVQYKLDLNPFFDLRDDLEDLTTFSLFQDTKRYGGAFLTVAGTNSGELYYILAEIMNHRFMYYTSYTYNSEEGRRIRAKEIAPNFNYIVNHILTVISIEVRAGLIEDKVVYDSSLMKQIIEISQGNAIDIKGVYTVLLGSLKSCEEVLRQVPQSSKFSSLVPGHIPLPPPLNMGNVNMPALGPMPPPVRSGRPLPPPPPGAVVMPRQPVRLPRRAANLPPPREDWLRMMMQQR